MAYKVGGTQVAIDGAPTPYLWGSGDTTTVPSNETKILASDGAAGDRFGQFLAIGSGKIVVGARYDDDNGSASGSVYVYDLDGTNEIKITPSDGAASDQFGSSVAVGCGKIVVSAPNETAGGGSQAGAVYVYDLDGTNEIKITASDSAAGDRFGTSSIAVGNGKIVVGATGYDYNTNVNTDSGAVYIYNLDGTGEIIVQGLKFSGEQFGKRVAVGSGKIVATSSTDFWIFNLDGSNKKSFADIDGVDFGSSLAIGDGRLLIGASGWATNRGRVYVYDIDSLQRLLLITSMTAISASDGASGEWFGYSVAISNGKIVVGAFFDESEAGSVYIYDTPQVYTVWDAIDLQYG